MLSFRGTRRTKDEIFFPVALCFVRRRWKVDFASPTAFSERCDVFTTPRFLIFAHKNSFSEMTAFKFSFRIHTCVLFSVAVPESPSGDFQKFSRQIIRSRIHSNIARTLYNFELTNSINRWLFQLIRIIPRHASSFPVLAYDTHSIYLRFANKPAVFAASENSSLEKPLLCSFARIIYPNRLHAFLFCDTTGRNSDWIVNRSLSSL